MFVLKCDQVSKTIGRELVLDQVSFELADGEAAVVAGTDEQTDTLMGMLADQIACHNGSLGEEKIKGNPSRMEDPTWGTTVFAEARAAVREGREMEEELYNMELSMMYLKSQAYMDVRREHEKLSKQLKEEGGYKYEKAIPEVLHSLGFTEDDHARMNADLDEDEKYRLNTAKLLLGGTDVLMLEYPEKHMEPDMIGRVSAAVRARGGVVIAVTERADLLGEDVKTVAL